MGDESHKRARASRKGWTEEQKQAARERENQRRAQLDTRSEDDLPRVPSGFVVFPSWMLPDRSVSDLGKWVILALSLYASRDGLCWPTAATIAHTLNRSERTVFRGLNEVVALGLVSVVPRFRNGAQISSVYRLEFSRWGSIKPPPDKNDIPGESKLTSQGCQNRHAEQDPKTGSSEHENTPLPPTGETERAPRAALGKKAGDRTRGEGGQRPRMVQLRDELLTRIEAWNPDWNPFTDPHEVVDRKSGDLTPARRLEQLHGMEEYVAKMLAASLRDGDLEATVARYANIINETMWITSEEVIPAARAVAAQLDQERERIRAELRQEVIRDYERNTLRDPRAWRAKLARIGA